MANDEQLLSGLQEIPLPPLVSYWPRTMGWAILAAILVAAVAYAVWRWHRRRLANRYRRTALLRLRELQRQADDPSARSSSLSMLPQLVKQTALSFCPRHRIASLSDRTWLEFLDRTYRPRGFAEGPGRLLPRLAYASPDELSRIPDTDIQALFSLVGNWITHHRACV